MLIIAILISIFFDSQHSCLECSCFPSDSILEEQFVKEYNNTNEPNPENEHVKMTPYKIEETTDNQESKEEIAYERDRKFSYDLGEMIGKEFLKDLEKKYKIQEKETKPKPRKNTILSWFCCSSDD